MQATHFQFIFLNQLDYVTMKQLKIMDEIQKYLEIGLIDCILYHS